PPSANHLLGVSSTSLTQAYPAPPRSSWCPRASPEHPESPPGSGKHQLDTSAPRTTAVELVLDHPRASPEHPESPPGSVKHQLDTSVPRTPAVELGLDHPKSPKNKNRSTSSGFQVTSH